MNAGLLSFNIFLIVLVVHIVLYAVGGTWLVANYKKQRDYSRIYLGCFLLGLAISCATFVLTSLFRAPDADFAHSMLEPYPSIISFPIMVLAPLYIVEIIRPQLLTARHVFFMACPWIVVATCFIIWHASTGFASVTPIRSLDDLVREWPHAEIILRCMLAAIYIPFGLMVFATPDNWRKTSAPQPWIRILTILVCLSTFTFVFGMLCRIEWIMIVHVAVFDAICLAAFYMESRVRMPVPYCFVPMHETKKAHVLSNDKNNDLSQRLTTLMESGVWQNPEFGRDDICLALATNRSYLASVIQNMGYSSCTDLMNKYRLEYIYNEITKQPKADAQDIVFQAGFRNRATANRVFTQQYGCTISAHQKSLINK